MISMGINFEHHSRRTERTLQELKEELARLKVILLDLTKEDKDEEEGLL
jgi:hypothetical protein